MRTPVRYEVRGEMLTVKEICDRYGVKQPAVYARLRKGDRGDALVRGWYWRK